VLPSDKEVIEVLRSALENLFVQNIEFRGQLRRARAEGFRDNVDKTGQEAVALLVRESFVRKYAQAIQSVQALKDWLEKLPTVDPIQ
jgi:hypothetical protein